MAPRKATIYQIAEMAGVSIGTVSRVMNGKDRVAPDTRARILAIAEKFNFRPNAAARGLATRRTSTLMLLVSDIANVYFAEMAKQINRHAAARGYRLVLGDSDEAVAREADYLRTLEDRHVDGAIVAPLTTEANLPLYRAAIAAGCPVVLLDTEIEGTGAPCVRVDNEAGARLAVEHLAARGHRRIAFVSGNIAFQTNRLRYQGFRAAMQAAGLPATNEYLVPNQDFLQEEGFCGVEQLLALATPPTAIFATSDLTAMACIRSVRRAGLRVPGDVAVVGFDDLSISAHMEIPLTTVAQPKSEIARTAVQMLVDAVEHPDPAQPAAGRCLAPSLVVRDSA